MEAKLSGWRRNSLIGQAGAPLSSHLHKTHLLSSMLFFNIPNQVCSKLDSLVGRFCSNTRQFVALKAWDKICQPKC